MKQYLQATFACFALQFALVGVTVGGVYGANPREVSRGLQ